MTEFLAKIEDFDQCVFTNLTIHDVTVIILGHLTMAKSIGTPQVLCL